MACEVRKAFERRTPGGNQSQIEGRIEDGNQPLSGNQTGDGNQPPRGNPIGDGSQPLYVSPAESGNRPLYVSRMAGEAPKADGPTGFWGGEAWASGSGFPAGSGVQPRSV